MVFFHRKMFSKHMKGTPPLSPFYLPICIGLAVVFTWLCNKFGWF